MKAPYSCISSCVTTLAEYATCVPGPKMVAVNPDEIERCLIESGKQFLLSLAEKQIVIDGKKLQGANPTARGTKGDHVLNAFISENHLLIGQSSFEK